MCSLYEKKHLSITYSTPNDHAAYFYADKGRIFQIIRILMENSLRFTKEGSITLEIKQDSPDLTTIVIADTGCGIEKDILKILFEMFPGADAPLGKKTKSRGMSLSVVKKLCDMMGVTIEVSSWVGAGTKFKLSVPRREL
jgi:signal transduction histidine kinase